MLIHASDSTVICPTVRIPVPTTAGEPVALQDPLESLAQAARRVNTVADPLEQEVHSARAERLCNAFWPVSSRPASFTARLGSRSTAASALGSKVKRLRNWLRSIYETDHSSGTRQKTTTATIVVGEPPPPPPPVPVAPPPPLGGATVGGETTGGWVTTTGGSVAG